MAYDAFVFYWDRGEEKKNSEEERNHLNWINGYYVNRIKSELDVKYTQTLTYVLFTNHQFRAKYFSIK